MGFTEYIIVLCFVITIWMNSVNADLDCRRFVFAPSCRGVSAKRSAIRSTNHHNYNDGAMSDDFMPSPLERHSRFGAEFGAELVPILETKRLQKRFADLLQTSILRKTRSRDLTRYNLLLNSMNNLLASQGNVLDN